MKRLKAPRIADTDTFFQTVNRIAELQAAAAVIAARRDRAIQRLQAKFAEKLKPFEDEIEAKLALADAFAEEHRDELLPKGRKSVELAQAVFGFRTGMPQLKTLARWTWDKVRARLAERFGDDDYVRTKVEVDKAAILAEVAKKGHIGEETTLEMIGLQVVQAETFYIEPKVETGETLKPAEAAA